MNIRGYFMLLMSTIWRTVVTQLKATFRYRVAGGSDNSSLPERKGRAVLQKVYGKTVKFNQLVQNGNFADTSHWTSWSISPATLAVAGNVATIRKDSSAAYGGFLYDDGITPNATHKYYLTAKLARVDASAYFGFVKSSGAQGSNTMLASFTTNLDKYALITSPSSNTDKLCLRCGLGSTAINSSCKAADVMTIDLTDIFGTDAEIAAALGISVSDITTDVGVAAFEAWLALNPGYQDYYPYMASGLISFTGSKVKSVGFNKWDEQAISGTLNSANGAVITPYNNRIVSTNYIKVLPNTKYSTNKKKECLICFYDKDYNTLQYVKVNSADAGVAGMAADAYPSSNTFVTPANCAYIKFSAINYSLPYANDLCINISDDDKNGTYEPYHEEIVDLSGAYINVWDEEVTIGNLNPTSGAITSGTRVCSKNYIQVKPQETYYFREPDTNNYAIVCYDAQKSIIPGIDPSGFYFVGYNTAFTMPANCYYIRFRMPAGYGDTYKHNLCINVSNADINGTYYPHALQSAGSVTDEVTETEMKKKLSSVDLGNLVWRYRGAQAANVISTASITNYAHKGGKLSVCYPYSAYNSVTNINQMPNAPDKCHTFFATSSSNSLYIKDSDIAEADIDAQGHCQKLEGVILIYELATPITIPHDTPMQYKVDKYSTEEVIFPESADGSPTSTNIVVDIEYQAK